MARRQQHAWHRENALEIRSDGMSMGGPVVNLHSAASIQSGAAILRRLSALVLGLALAVTLLAGCSTQTTTVPQVPRFESAPCVSKLGGGIADGLNAYCGYLIVREDRTNPRSRLIKLAAVRLRTDSVSPDPDPVIYLSGGPGESPLTDFVPEFTSASLSYVLGNRDLIIFDPRGTAYSQPSLDCLELREAEYGALDRNLSPPQQTALDRTALTACYTRLTNAGINLSLYNTATSAADVHDLIQALGYNLVNLEGGSYGTRLALQVMHDYPFGIRSVILDAVFPPQATFFTMIPPALMRSYDMLFATCAASASCNARYPQLESMLSTLIAQLDAHPATLAAQDPYTDTSYHVVLNGARLVSLLTLSLYQTDLIPRIPLAISSALHGDTSQLQPMFDAVWFTEDAIARGMWYSTECREDAPFVTQEQLDAALAALSAPLRAADPFNMESRLDACQFWKVAPAPASQKQAVVSSIPTLVLEGEFDPVNPPSNGQLAASTLSASTFLVFPGAGHGVMYTGPCPLRIALGFFEATGHEVDTSCIQQMGEPSYL